MGPNCMLRPLHAPRLDMLLMLLLFQLLPLLLCPGGGLRCCPCRRLLQSPGMALAGRLLFSGGCEWVTSGGCKISQ